MREFPAQEPSSASVASQPGTFSRGILFTGHRIDEPGREEPRFPPRAEAAVRDAIRSALLDLRTPSHRETLGIAAGASGGDILFHEICADLGIPTRMLLALPPAEFACASVAHAGAQWMQRFQALVHRLGPANVIVMSAGDGFVHEITDTVWQRASLWMIEELCRLTSDRVLLALWDGKPGDGPGGTEYLVRVAPEHGLRVAPVIAIPAVGD